MSRHRSLLVVPLLFTACHVADVDRLTAHMIDTCQVAPPLPACALDDGNDEGRRAGMARFARNEVTSPEIERCLLDVDCSDARVEADPAGPVAELSACLNGGGGGANPTCLDACHGALIDCRGDDGRCDADDVERCLDGFERCRSDC
jgi:hypothetical protein